MVALAHFPATLGGKTTVRASRPPQRFGKRGSWPQFPEVHAVANALTLSRRARCRPNCTLLRSTVGYETWPYREARREIEPEKGCKGSASGKARAECSSAGRVAPPARGRAAKTGIRVPISAMAVDMPGLELCGEQSSPIYSGDLDSRQKPFRRNLAWSAP